MNGAFRRRDYFYSNVGGAGDRHLLNIDGRKTFRKENEDVGPHPMVFSKREFDIANG